MKVRSFESSIISIDEFLLHDFYPEDLKQYSAEWVKNTEEKKIIPSMKSSLRIMILIACNEGKIFAYQFVEGTVTSETIVDFLENSVLPAWNEKRANEHNPAFDDEDMGVKVLMDNAPVHRTKIVHQWFVNNDWETLDLPSHSADLNP